MTPWLWFGLALTLALGIYLTAMVKSMTAKPQSQEPAAVETPEPQTAPASPETPVPSACPEKPKQVFPTWEVTGSVTITYMDGSEEKLTGKNTVRKPLTPSGIILNWEDLPIQWTSDGKHLLVKPYTVVPVTAIKKAIFDPVEEWNTKKCPEQETA